jgi:hypothetical protein
MEKEIYRKIAAILETEMVRVRKFDTPLEHVLENLADRFIYEASLIEQSRGNDQ